MDDNLKARIIASAWHGGQFTALYALSSTGATELVKGDWPRILEEIDDNLTADTPELRWLEAYVEADAGVGPRGPMAGWSDLHWSPADEHEVLGDA